VAKKNTEIQIKLVRSPIGKTKKQKRTLEALGLRKINQIKLHKDNPAIQGMISRVKHLVTVVEG